MTAKGNWIGYKKTMGNAKQPKDGRNAKGRKRTKISKKKKERNRNHRTYMFTSATSFTRGKVQTFLTKTEEAAAIGDS